MESNGFEVIKEGRIQEKEIDGVIISSYICRNEIVARMKAEFKDISYLDIFDEPVKVGSSSKGVYYSVGSQYIRCCKLNALQREFQ